MNELHRRYGEQIEFLAIYLREAHPTDGWQVADNERSKVLFVQPRDLTERRAVAQKCCQALQIKMPVLVDEMDDRVGRAFNAKPDRLYLIDNAGRVAYRGGPGPFGYNPAELEQSLIMLLLDQDAAAAKSSPVGTEVK